MIFHSTKIPGVFQIEIEPKEDDRGYFSRIFDEKELEAHGVFFRVRQSNRSFSKIKGTIRGMHFQKAPAWEGKLMTAIQGSFHTIVADLRPDTPTYKQWISVELSAEKKNMLLIPPGCGNGFQTLEDNSEMLYFMSEFYSPKHAIGFNYADQQFGFVWPLGEPTVISQKDKMLPNFTE